MCIRDSHKEYLQKNNIKIDETGNDLAFELSNLVTHARLYAGISQAELAKRIGTKQPSIARVENGNVYPSMNFLEKIARAVNTYLIPPRFAFMDSLEANTVNQGDNPKTGTFVLSPLVFSTTSGGKIVMANFSN